MVMIANTLRGILNEQLHLDWSVRIFIVFVWFAALALAQIRILKYLVPFSILANVMIMIVLIITIYLSLDEPLNFENRKPFAPIRQWPYFFSIVIFAMENIGSVMPIENDMEKPEHFLGWFGVVNSATIIIVFLYGFVGFIGYIRFGDAVQASITLNLPLDNM